MRLIHSSLVRRVAALAILVASAGACSDTTSSFSIGRLMVSVKDEAGVGVGGIPVDLFRTDGTAWAGLYTSADGGGEFRAGDGGVLADTYKVRVQLSGSPNLSLAPNETNDKTAVVTSGGTITVSFKLARRTMGPTV